MKRLLNEVKDFLGESRFRMNNYTLFVPRNWLTEAYKKSNDVDWVEALRLYRDCMRNAVSEKDFTSYLDEKFYNEYILYEVVGYITENIWLKKSYWSFMRHMIADSRTDVNLWRDYKFNVNIFENGEIHFEFTKKM